MWSLSLGLLTAIALPGESASRTTSCSVSKMYSQLRYESDLYVQVSSGGRIERPYRAYREAEIKPGRYRVKVTSEGSDTWRTEEGIVIETGILCGGGYLSREAVLEVRAFGSTLTFDSR